MKQAPSSWIKSFFPGIEFELKWKEYEFAAREGKIPSVMKVVC